MLGDWARATAEGGPLRSAQAAGRQLAAAPAAAPTRDVQFIVKKETGWVNVERDGELLKEQAMTGFSLNLREGRHELKFTRTNHQSLMLPVEVTANGTSPREPIVVGLMPLKARLSWRGVTVGSTVQIYRESDNKFVVGDYYASNQQEAIYIPLEPGKRAHKLRVQIAKGDSKTSVVLNFSPGKLTFLPPTSEQLGNE